jgi:hypothetical protein
VEVGGPKVPVFCRRCGAAASLSWKLIILTWRGACCTWHPAGYEEIEVGWCIGCWEPQPERVEDTARRLQELGVDLFPGWEEANRGAMERERMLQ